MAPPRHLDSHAIDERAQRFTDRSFLGGMRLSARSGLFFFLGMFALGGLGALYWQIDQRVAAAFDDAADARKLAFDLAKVEREVQGLRAPEKDFFLRREASGAEAMNAAIERAAAALDKVLKAARASEVQSHAATLRDGLAQYANTFSEVVKLETLVGFAPDQGLLGQIQGTTAKLEGRFRELGLSAAMVQLARLQRMSREAMIPGAKIDLPLFEKNYETLRLLVAAAQIAAKEKGPLEGLAKSHEADTMTLLNARLRLDQERRAFDEVFSYMGPSLEALAAYAERRTTLAAERFESLRAETRPLIAASGGGAALVLLLLGLLLLRSVAAPVRRLAEVAARLAAGERAVQIPALGNLDSVGQVARGLDAWLDSLADLDHLRAELEDTKLRLKAALGAPALPAPARAAVAVPEAEVPLAALSAPAPEPEPAKPARPAEPSQALVPVAAEEEGGALAKPAGRIANASQRLGVFTQKVATAAREVERTESLVRGLADANEQVVEMGTLVAAIRDQTNLLVFRTGVRGRESDRAGEKGDRPDENLILLSPDMRLPSDPNAEPPPLARFDAIRDALDRAERTVQAAHTSIVEVMEVAHEIAAEASNAALEATDRLLAQSEFLHNMLDDIIAKIPAPGGEERGSRDAKGGAKSRPGRDGA